MSQVCNKEHCYPHVITRAGVCHFRATEVRLYVDDLSLPILSYPSIMFQASNITKQSQTTSQCPLEEAADFLLLGNAWLLLCLYE